LIVVLTFGNMMRNNIPQPIPKMRMAQLLEKRQICFPRLSLFLTIATGIFLASCQSSDTTRPDIYSQSSAPKDFQLMIGEGGGFTGIWTGYVVDSTGTVSSWRGISPDQNTKRTGKLGRQQFEKIWQMILNARFFDIDSTGTGNMTVAMQVSASGTVHRTSWAKPSGTRSPLAPVQLLYDSCRTIVSRAK
jgi:hypothetical protein